MQSTFVDLARGRSRQQSKRNMLRDRNERVRVAVLSDIHAYSTRGLQRPSFATTVDREHDHDPLGDLARLIDREELEVDVLLCGGDLGDRADADAIRFVWSHLPVLCDRMGAGHLLATAGNHDVDSRFTLSAFDPRKILQDLEPPFPGGSEDEADQYWGPRHYLIRTTDDLRVVTLDTTGFHGAPGEHAHGRLSPQTVTRLATALRTTPAPPVNILLTHHQPLPDGDIPDDGRGASNDLLTLLASGDVGDWMIIHGHRHWPAVGYANAQPRSPIVFSAGSLSAVLYTGRKPQPRNQFYVLEFLSSTATSLVGTFQAWDWCAGSGWEPARRSSGLAHRGAFGFRGSARWAADQIADLVRTTAHPWLDWRDIATHLPELAFLLPRQFDELVAMLKAERDLAVVLGETGTDLQIGPRQ